MAASRLVRVVTGAMAWALASVAVAQTEPAPAPQLDIGRAAVGGKPAATIVARVDNEVILLEEVLAPLRPKLEEARRQLPPGKYREFELRALHDVTEARVQRMVVMAELKQRIKEKTALDRIKKNVAQDFEKYLLNMARQAGFKTREEIVEELKKQGTGLESLREDFIENMLAQQYVYQLVKSQIKEPTRAELLRYYQELVDDFRTEVGAVWHHIEIKKKDDPEKSRRTADELLRRLKSGAPFAELAKQFSEGPTKLAGGEWSLTSKGSFAEPKVDEALFTLEVGKFSDVIEGKTSWHIVLVSRRSDGTAKPFSEVQTKIADLLTRDQQTALRKVKFEELMAKHHIENIFAPPQTTATAGNPKPVR